MRSSEFMRAMPEAVRQHLPGGLVLHNGRVWSFGAQLYDDNPRFHYEVVRVPRRMGDRLELGLHFESRSAAHNHALLAGFVSHLVEIKGELGASMEAEPWDRGWTKVYETMPLAPYGTVYLDVVAHRLAEIIRVLHPIYRSLQCPNPKPLLRRRSCKDRQFFVDVRLVSARENAPGHGQGRSRATYGWGVSADAGGPDSVSGTGVGSARKSERVFSTKSRTANSATRT